MKEKISFEWVKKHFFSDPEKQLRIRKGDLLIDQNQINKYLYLVLEGRFNGYFADSALASYPIFEAGKNKFIGVYSYFSADNKSYSKVVATEDSVVAYYDKPLAKHSEEEWMRLAPFLISVVVNELYSRQHYARKMTTEKYNDVQKLLKAEKIATLGQMAAGIAHELNNAVGVLDKGTDHLRSFFNQQMAGQHELVRDYFEKGCEHGQEISSEEARRRRKDFEKLKGLTNKQVKRLARTGIDPAVAQQYLKKDPDAPEKIYESWEAGCTLHDMTIAARHATQVVRSVKQLGATEHTWSDNIMVNNTIEEALIILKNLTKRVRLVLILDQDQPPTSGYYGPLIQVWINIIKNGIESVLSSDTAGPVLTVKSEHDEEFITVSISDNGPGISKKIMERIFEPSFTTKVGGLSFGLGLGLSIVQRIVTEHNGQIEVSSSPELTIFSVKIPIIKK